VKYSHLERGSENPNWRRQVKTKLKEKRNSGEKIQKGIKLLKKGTHVEAGNKLGRISKGVINVLKGGGGDTIFGSRRRPKME
jgi:hypothetical protein